MALVTYFPIAVMTAVVPDVPHFCCACRARERQSSESNLASTLASKKDLGFQIMNLGDLTIQLSQKCHIFMFKMRREISLTPAR